MKPEKIKILAFDLDGTLLSDVKNIPEENLKTLKRASELGYELVISTGRGLGSLPDTVLSIEEFRYAIVSNGAHIVDLSTKEAVRSWLLTEEMLLPVMKYIEDPELMKDIFCDFKIYADIYCLEHLPEFGVTNPVSMKYLWDTRTPVENSLDMMRQHYGKIENINLFFRDPEKRLRYWDEMKAFPQVNVVSSMPNNLEIGAGNASKANALAAFAEMKGLSLENVMCFGDSSNDAAMVGEAGIGVAMGNATEDLKAIADYITINNNEGGVAYAIHEILGI